MKTHAHEDHLAHVPIRWNHLVARACYRVSEEADQRITEQAKAGVFPIRLKPEDWNSGPNNWLLDVIAPDAKATARVIANFKQVVKEGSLKLHPLIARLVEPETLKKMGAAPMGRAGEGDSNEPV